MVRFLCGSLFLVRNCDGMTLLARGTTPAIGLKLSMSTSAAPQAKPQILLSSTKNNVTTLTMNTPTKLNGWTQEMLLALKEALSKIAKDPETKVAILTGKDPYYCAGVNLSSTLKPMHPKILHRLIIENNAAVFNAFIEFPKPIIVAANGPAIGASVTTATLCDAIIASERATFSTPFARLGIPPEGCSSVHFEKIMGKKNAERMLGPEGWAPTAAEAQEAGFVAEVVPHDQLKDRAQEVAEMWVREGKVRSLIAEELVDEYKKVNWNESKDLATAFLSYPFLNAQYQFLMDKGKLKQAIVFWFLKTSRPLWSKLL